MRDVVFWARYHCCTHEVIDYLTTARSALEQTQQNSTIDKGGGSQGNTPAEEQLRTAQVVGLLISQGHGPFMVTYASVDGFMSVNIQEAQIRLSGL